MMSLRTRHSRLPVGTGSVNHLRKFVGEEAGFTGAATTENLVAADTIGNQVRLVLLDPGIVFARIHQCCSASKRRRCSKRRKRK